MYRRAVGLVLLALTFAVTPLSSAAPTAGGTFRVAEPATYTSSIDGALASLASDLTLLNIVCASLVRPPDKPLPEGARLTPELAAGFPKVSADRKTYTFTIRNGLRFSTGAPVTAADVAYTINRILNPRLQSPNSSGFNTIVGAQKVLAGKARTASGIRTSGRTLTIKLVHPVGAFLEDFISGLCVLPANLPLQPNGVTPPVPSPAPYYIAEYVPAQRIVLKRNTYYRGSRPQHVDRFVFDLTVDDNQALDDVVTGAADYAWVAPPSYAARTPEFAQRFGVNKRQFFVKRGSFLRMFALNTSRPLLRNNVRLRRAINFAVDRRALVGVAGSLSGVPADHYVLPIMPGYQRVHVYPVGRPNVAKARALARGQTRGGTLVLYVPTRPGAKEQAQIIKQNLKQIGLDVEIKIFPAGPAYFDRLANPAEPFDMAWYNTLLTTLDPGTSLNGLFDGGAIGTPANGNFSYFNSARWNRALRRASRLSGKARFRTYGRLDVRLAREAAPTLAWSVDNALTLVSARTGCVVANPYLDVEAACLK
jgi:peptide/nickel transport system substrate-binding protein